MRIFWSKVQFFKEIFELCFLCKLCKYLHLYFGYVLSIINNINFFQCAAFLSLGVICISTICFVLSTLPELQEEEFEGKFFFREIEIYLKLFIIFFYFQKKKLISVQTIPIRLSQLLTFLAFLKDPLSIMISSDSALK